MKKHVDYKVPDGKLIRIDLEIKENIIKDIKITGDFFIHPEEGITLIEKSLKGINKNQVGAVLKKVVDSNNINIIGFSASDMKKIISSIV